MVWTQVFAHDSESLDRCIQTTLSALFPPFQETSPTVLCQVLSVVERCYRGDGLRYLLHFLLPAKQFLQSLQQDACLPYCGLLFRHEGWPLCLHEKVVIQLCHLDQCLLRPGDFYLLVSPSSASASTSFHRSASRQGPPTPRLLLCSVSTVSRHVEEQEIPELALSSLFTMAWLDSVNRDREQRGVSRIERVLLSAHGDVFRVPWDDVVYPQFINRPRSLLKEASVNNVCLNASLEQEKTQEGATWCSNGHSLSQNSTHTQCTVDQSTPSSDDSDSEGEYVELSEMPRFSPQKGSLTQLISQQHKAKACTRSPDKNKSAKVPTEFQSTPKHSKTTPKDSFSSRTEEMLHNSNPIEEKDSSVALNGPVILTPIAQPATDEITQCAEHDTRGTTSSKSLDSRPARQDYKNVVEKMDLIDFDGEHVVSIEDRKEGESENQSVEEEQEGVPIEQKSLEEGEVVLEVEVIKEQEKCETRDQECRLEEQNEDIHLGELLSTDSQDVDASTQNGQTTNNLDAHSGFIDLDKMHVEETNSEKSQIILDTEDTYLDTGNSQNKDIEKFKPEYLYNQESNNIELSLDAFINSQLQKHSEMSHTRIIYLEANDAGYFELFHCQNSRTSDKKEEFENTNTKKSDQGLMPDRLGKVVNQSFTDTEHCEMAEQHQSLVEGQRPCVDAELENTQIARVETETEDVCTKIDLEMDDVDQMDSQARLPEDPEETVVDLETENVMAQNNCCILKVDPEASNEKDSEQAKQMELVNDVHRINCEELKTLPVPFTFEDSSSVNGSIKVRKNNTHADTLPYGKPQEDSIVISHVEDGPITVPTLAKSNVQHLEDLEIKQLISEMVDSVERAGKNCLRRRPKRNSMRYLNSSVEAMEQQIDMLETEFKHLQCKIKKMENKKLEEKQNGTEELCVVKTEEATACCKVTEPKYDEKVTNLEENIEKVANISSKMSVQHDEAKTQGDSNHPLPDAEQTMETAKMNNGLIEQMEKMFEHSDEQNQTSLVKSATVEILEEFDVLTTELPTEPMPSMDTPSINSLTSNAECQVTAKPKLETLEINQNKGKSIVMQPGIYESHKTQETKMEETEEPKNIVSENGLKLEDLKNIDKPDIKCCNSDQSSCQNGQIQMAKVQRTNHHKPANGPMVKPSETKHVFESRKGQSLNKVQTQGPNSVHLSNGSKPEPPENLLLSRLSNHSVPLQLSKSPQSRFNKILLSSGVLCLPGTRDRSGRALVTVNTKNPLWSSPDCDSAELLQVLLYYCSTLRKEVQALGLTVLVDVRRAPPVFALFTALRSLQESTPGSVHAVLLLLNKDSPVRTEKPPSLQVEMLYSMKSLQKHVDLRQLPLEFGGSFNFSQSSWLCYRTRVENLTNQCNNVIGLLQKTIHVLESTALPSDAQNAEQLLSKYKAVMCSILQDSRLVQLQQEGGASLSRLRRDESSICATEDYRAAVDSVSSLYEQVDELLHRLVTLSNSKTQELHFILEFSAVEPGFSQVRRWLQQEGEQGLKSLEEPDDSLELVLLKQTHFRDFCSAAHEWCGKGQALLKRLEHWDSISSADLHHYEVKVHAFWAELQDFSQRVTAAGKNIERAVQLYSFLDQAYEWALAGMRHLAGVSMEDCALPDKRPAVMGCLEDYHRLHPPIPDARFQEMRALAGELRGERGLRQWSFAWAKCQETKKMFDRKMEAALRTKDSAQRRRSDSDQSKSSIGFSRKSLSGLWNAREPSQASPTHDEDAVSTCSSSTPSPPRNKNSTPVTSTPQHTPLLHRLFRSPSSSDDTKDSIEIPPSPAPSFHRLDLSSSSSTFTSPSVCSSSFSSRRQQLRKTQSFDVCPATPEPARYGAVSPRTLSEPASRRGNTGVFIKGLEVTSTEAADRTLCPRTGSGQVWTGPASRSPSTQSINSLSAGGQEQRPRGSKLRHIVEEMVTTERDYVRSLRYIIHHYFPEMERPDVPQDLRGKRSVVFGNLEKLLDFHSQFFLKELEACWKHPLRVPHCFLRHQEQFSLYALYSKNKPKSDALLLTHGNSFFRRKQVELGDKMDLSSYLLKPVQRMSKYALLLSDLMKEVGVSQEAELASLHAATSMVKFQLRHGNDLLAMDAIRDCDVNLKEQGQLIRQDEFTVWSGRRKCQRHVFLFEDLVLFSKPKRMEGGLDVYIYKHSFKTADVGLTESTGDDGLRFEIWFRRRTSKNQTFLLQASSSEVKQNWTSDIARLLWTQATRNKEMRLKEMVSMGVGNKPFLDIQPSDAAISDRAVHYIMKSRGARTRASIAVSVFDHSNPFKRSVTSDPSAALGPSSCSLLGPLNLHMFSQTLPPAGAAEGSFITSCIEEDEQEVETSSQPSMTTESSGSSSRCLSGSTGSDSGCVSSHLQEALQEEPNPSQASSSSSTSSSSKQHLSSAYISPNTSPVISPATIV